MADDAEKLDVGGLHHVAELRKLGLLRIVKRGAVKGKLDANVDAQVLWHLHQSGGFRFLDHGFGRRLGHGDLGAFRCRCRAIGRAGVRLFHFGRDRDIVGGDKLQPARQAGVTLDRGLVGVTLRQKQLQKLLFRKVL